MRWYRQLHDVAQVILNFDLRVRVANCSKTQQAAQEKAEQVAAAATREDVRVTASEMVRPTRVNATAKHAEEAGINSKPSDRGLGQNPATPTAAGAISDNILESLECTKGSPLKSPEPMHPPEAPQGAESVPTNRNDNLHTQRFKEFSSASSAPSVVRLPPDDPRAGPHDVNQRLWLYEDGTVQAGWSATP